MSATVPGLNAGLIGQTEKALNAFLDRLLAEPRLNEHQWIVLTLTAASGGAIGEEQLVKRAVGALKIAPAEVSARLRELGDAGLVRVVGRGHVRTVELTSHGREVQTQIQARAVAFTEDLWGDLPPDDLDAAARVLNTILDRANVALKTV